MSRQSFVWHARILLFSLALAVGIFLGDLFVPLDVAGGVLYVVAVLVTMWAPGRRYTEIVAFVATLFLFLGYMLDPAGVNPIVDVVNRILGLLAVWLTAVLVSERRRSEEYLKASEAKVRSIFNATADGIVSVDFQNRLDAHNPAARKIFGYEPEEMLDLRIGDLAAAAGDLNEALLHAREPHGNGQGYEVVGVRKDGSTFPMQVTFSRTTSNGDGHLTAVLRDLSTQRQLEQEVLRVAEQERRRVGNQLHEGLGQMLTGIGLITRSLHQKLRAERNLHADDAAQIIDFLHEADEYTRDLSRGLVPLDQDETGLSHALQRLASNVGEKYKLVCEFRQTGTPVLMSDPVIGAHLYQIVQDAVHALARSAKARYIRIGLAGSPSEAKITLVDDGPNDPQSTDGFIRWEKILSYRARLIGGTLKMERRSEGGRLTCTLPVQS